MKLLTFRFALPLLLPFLFVDLAPAQGGDVAPLTESFPEKVGDYARTSLEKTETLGEATEAMKAKYSAPSGDITWRGLSFATPEAAIATLAEMAESMTSRGGKVLSSINNTEGKVRFTVLETKAGTTYLWVNKKQKNLLYMLTGTAPDVAKFVELQKTW